MEWEPILGPIVALVAWTLIVMLWMVIVRMGEFRRMGVTLGTLPVGSRGVDLDVRAEAAAAQWKSHNYNHLLEQPTIFYAIALTHALMGSGGGSNVWLAWGYVGLRVVHSLVQCTINVVAYRFALFFLASLCLVGLTINGIRDIVWAYGMM